MSTKHSTKSTTTHRHHEENVMSTHGKPTIDPKAIVFINPPPANANIPAPDAGWEPPAGNRYRGVVPKNAEVQALPDAIDELRAFGAYAATFANLAPPQDQLVQLLDAAEQWSKMAKATALWSRYCKVEEGIVWTAVRGMVARLLPAFQLAQAADPTITGKLPKTAAFLGVRKQIARTAASTKAMNGKAKASGQPAFHGQVGKRRKSKAARLALEAQHGAEATAPVVAEPPPEPPPAVTNGVTNGAAHV